MALVGFLLALTGGASSPYFPLYPLAVIGSAFAVRPGATLITGVAAIFGWVVIVGIDTGQLRVTPETLDGASLRLAALGVATIMGVVLTQSLKRSTERLTELALTDPLTGLRNRAVLPDTLRLFHSLAERTARPYSVLALDLDGLKTINDSIGRDAGDRAIVAAADAVRAVVRATDVPIRTGGDEFIVLLPDTRTDGARIVGERIRAALAVHTGATLSIGAAGWAKGAAPAAVLTAADDALYRAKREGRKRTVAWLEAYLPADRLP